MSARGALQIFHIFDGALIGKGRLSKRGATKRRSFFQRLRVTHNFQKPNHMTRIIDIKRH